MNDSRIAPNKRASTLSLSHKHIGMEVLVAIETIKSNVLNGGNRKFDVRGTMRSAITDPCTLKTFVCHVICTESLVVPIASFLSNVVKKSGKTDYRREKIKWEGTISPLPA